MSVGKRSPETMLGCSSILGLRRWVGSSFRDGRGIYKSTEKIEKVQRSDKQLTEGRQEGGRLTKEAPVMVRCLAYWEYWWYHKQTGNRGEKRLLVWRWVEHMI